MVYQTRKADIITKTIIVKTRGIDCVCHVWTSFPPPETKASEMHLFEPRGVVIIFHGLGGHAHFPTVKHLAILLAKHSFIVYAMDFPGHGESPGLRGYIASEKNLITDGLSVTLYVKKMHSHLPLFLAGSSMGGSIALAVANELNISGYNAAAGGDIISGLILMAPMISVSNISNCHQSTLKVLKKISPKAALFPPNEDSLEMQFRDNIRRKEVQNDKLKYDGNLRVGSAYSCLKLMKVVHKSLTTLSVPFICMIGSEDVVVDNLIVMTDLMNSAPSTDRTLKQYKALHGLICEALPVRYQIEKDLLKWLSRRAIVSPMPSPSRLPK